ncbi:BTAD domain-containing putative transcriptional regulator [Nocardioides cheoyonin]|uniref:BTAD domain-containing putative transcriptional regulator n=1 Tax=Nocardioides cheoyonin TaxID=3156615 RepID=UPI0032B58608
MTRLRVLDDVVWDGSPVPGERTHALLRALVEAGRRGLSESVLVDEVWGDDPPANPTKALQVVVSRARAATCPEAIERTPRGYRLALAPDEVDAWSLRPEALRLAAERRYADALPLLERAAVRADDDEVVAALLRAVAAVRGVPAALERYEAYRSGLADRLGVDPGPELRALHGELLARDRPVRSGVQYDTTSLIGREPDVAAVSVMLRSARVVTLLGAGGLGKTRLARVLAREAEQPVVHFVELVGVAAPDDVIGEVGSALGVRDSVSGRRILTPEQRADVRSRIAQQHDQAPALLVLDNCEHVVGAVADLVAFLVGTVPSLRVLTTSRSPLAIAAERVYPLGQLATADGVRLFEERATAARPGVALPEETVAEIVTRLDGLPLALELAAVKVRVMSVDDIAHRLSNRFELLRGGDRSAPDRHQTLLAVIDWSWNLLAEPERRALRQLSVFHDGFTLAAAEAILGPSALHAVEELNDQSLLTVVDTPFGVRYRMLETVREFGRMQLVDAGEEDEARLAQRTWAAAYADEYAGRLYGNAQPEAMDALRAEESNLADVLRQALAEPDPEAAVRIFAALGAYWTIAGDHPRVFTLISALAATLGDWTPPEELVDKTRLTVGLLIFGATLGSPSDAAQLRKLVERLGTDSASPPLRALLTIMLALGDGSGDELRAKLDELTDDADHAARGVAYIFRAHEKENFGDPRAALDAASHALALIREDDPPWNAATLHAQVAGLHAQLGELAKAATHAAAARPVLERLGAGDDVLQVTAILAMAALESGRVDEAARLVEEIDDRGTAAFGARGAVVAARAELALARGEIAEGLALYREAAEVLRTVRFPGVTDGFALLPWVVVSEATALAAYARFGAGDDGVDLYDSLAEKARPALEVATPILDYPVAGTLFFGTGLWALLRGALAPEDAVRLLVIAERFAYTRMAPAMRWEKAVEDAERIAPGAVARIEEEYADRRGPALLDEALDVVTHIFRL